MNKAFIIGNIEKRNKDSFIISSKLLLKKESKQEYIKCISDNKSVDNIINKYNNIILTGYIFMDNQGNDLIKVTQASPNNKNKPQKNLVIINGYITKIYGTNSRSDITNIELSEVDHFRIQINNNKDLIDITNNIPGSKYNYILSEKDNVYIISHISNVNLNDTSTPSFIIPIFDRYSIILDETINPKNNFKNAGFYIGYNLAYNNIKALTIQEGQNFTHIYTPNQHPKDLDKQICDNMYNLSKSNNMYYSQKDIINFHIAMKNRGITILSGLSGTGKTQLVRIYTQVLGLTNKQVNFIPINSDWTDNTDLLGFFDINDTEYKPSNTGLVHTLINAYNNPNDIYIVVLDEMNLSNVEYYFAQFLSILELPLNDSNRCIKLYDKKYDKNLSKSSSFPSKIKENTYPYKIPVKDNILFVGTINNDESTHKISDKVLDRSNIIHLHEQPFSSWNPNNKTKVIYNKKFPLITFNQFNSLKNDNPQNSLNNNELQLLDQINKQLQDASTKLGIGWRVVKQINEYLCDLPNNTIFSRNSALDYQLSQRILTKVSGSKIQLSKIFGEKCNTNDHKKIGTLEQLLRSYTKQHNTSFNESINTIHNKAKELNDYGFTL